MEEIKDKNLTLFFCRSSLLANPKKRFPKNSFFEFNKITAFSSNFKKLPFLREKGVLILTIIAWCKDPNFNFECSFISFILTKMILPSFVFLSLTRYTRTHSTKVAPELSATFKKTFRLYHFNSFVLSLQT